MQQDKIEAALTAALKHIEEAMNAHASNDEKAMSNSLWSTSAEAEYAVFVLSLLQNDKSHTTLKQEVSAEQSTEPESILPSAQQLLKSAKEEVQAGDHMRSYEEARTARNLLLKLQSSLEKKRKKDEQKKD